MLNALKSFLKPSTEDAEIQFQALADEINPSKIKKKFFSKLGLSVNGLKYEIIRRNS